MKVIEAHALLKQAGGFELKSKLASNERLVEPFRTQMDRFIVCCGVATDCQKV